MGYDNESSHPSHFLTTRDAKPRLFPFPLGKAGGQATKGELWWEAGNAAHVYVLSLQFFSHIELMLQGTL